MTEVQPPLPKPGHRQVRLAAHAIQDAYDAYSESFVEITRRAQTRFEKREWEFVLRDAEERIALYHDALSDIESSVRTILGPSIEDDSLWEQIKRLYLEIYLNAYHADLALIFFYSVMRRIFLASGRSVEYSDDEIHAGLPSRLDESSIHPYHSYPVGEVTADLVTTILDDFQFDAAYEDVGRDIQGIVRALEEVPAISNVVRIEMLDRAFFRNKAAYLIGRMVTGSGEVLPVVCVLLHSESGIVVDAVLTAEKDVSNVFTSARSNFHATVTAYREVFDFLYTVAPTRAKPYLYAALGFIHPAKLELVRQLRRHLSASSERFQVAEGTPGTVMVVFQHPGFNYVFKVIRDRSSKPTFQGRRHVVQQYWRVHQTDRVGRMLDIMTFHNLRFDASMFTEELLQELLHHAPTSVQRDGEDVVFRYVYAAREIVPLNVYLADEAIPIDQRNQAVIDYGYAIKDLTAAGLFVGDYMTKNFGVSRHGRVILYDYDDLDDLVNWNFRHLPDPPEWAEMLAYEDWLSAGAFDVFPEHDLRIFSVPKAFLQTFQAHHADLLTPEYWNGMKEQLKAGHVPDFYPYPRNQRLSERFTPA